MEHWSALYQACAGGPNEYCTGLDVLTAALPRPLESFAQRDMRVAAYTLRSGDKTDEQLKQLRKYLDQVREENRKQKELLEALEAKVK